MKYQREPLTDELIAEVLPLLYEHWEELAAYKDIRLDPDWNFYKQIQDAGFLHIFTVRNVNEYVVGYAAYIVKPNPHYKSSVQAACDVFFISRTHRSMFLVAKAFIEFCDLELGKLGAQVVHHRYKLAQPALGRLIKKMGYEDVEVTASRRL